MTAPARDADVIVIGAGPGGLTAAAYLTAIGKRVLVFDRHWVAGGNATTFTHHGYEFDVGLHYIGECQPGGIVPQLLTPLGIDIPFRELDPDGFDTFIYPDLEFRWPRGIDSLRGRLHETFPGESTTINKFLDTVVGLNDALTGAADGLSLAMAAGMIGRLGRIARHYRTTLGSFLDSIGASGLLREVLAAHSGIYALPPSRASLILHAAVIMHYANGGYYPEGGGQRISDELAAFIQRNGGEIVLRTPVEKVLVEGGRVRGVRVRPPGPERRRGTPTEAFAPIVISNADLKHTYLELVGENHLPANVVRRTRQFTMALPLFCLYLILDRDLRAEGFRNSNLNVLGDDAERTYAYAEAGHFPEDPSTFICSSTLKDPGNVRTCRPGETNVQIMTIAPRSHAYWGLSKGPHAGERYRQNPEYLARKDAYRETLVRKADRAIPGIADSIVYEESATPITHERFMDSTGGTSYGIEATPSQFLLGRPRPQTPIPGLYLCGANTTFAHGIVSTMLGGMITATIASGKPFHRAMFGDTLADRLAEEDAHRPQVPTDA